jgi:hypothetical protein
MHQHDEQELPGRMGHKERVCSWPARSRSPPALMGEITDPRDMMQ